MTNEQILREEYFKLMETYFDWQHQIDACNEMQELSKLQIQKSIEAITFLRNFLGEQFPKGYININHPICKYFWNMAPWTREWFTWIAHCFRELQQSDNFREVLKKFSSKTAIDFKEAITLLEAGLKFKRTGFTINFEAGIQNSKGENKVPDIELTNPVTSERIYVEVTRLAADTQLENYGSITERIIHGGMTKGKYLNFSGRLFKRLSDEHWLEILKEIDQKIIFSSETNSFVEISHNDIIELAIAPVNSTILAEWSSEKKYDINSFQLPPLNSFARIKGKIIQESKQTSGQHANVLIISHEDIHHHFISPEEYISEIEETIYKCTDLAAVIIIGYEFGGRDKVVQSHGMNFFVQKTERHAWSSRAVIIFNKFHHKIPVTLHTINKIIEAFIN